MKKGSVGTVTTSLYALEEPLELESGAVLRDVTLAYETYGRLNREKSNAILICHALSGDAHAAGIHAEDGRKGWWDIVIGPGKGFDTERYFVVCSNVLGGCKGSTGPASTNPETGKPYALSFPVVTIRDMVEAQKRLIDHLGIRQLYAVAGGSMGGMQVLQWCVSYPERVRKAIAIGTTAYSTPQQIAFNEVGRRAITSDPFWAQGDYYGRAIPSRGLALARMVGHITYLSDESMHAKFGRNLQAREKYGYDFSAEFQVESYLQHQGDAFTRRFDANSYLYITKAIDYFDLTKDGSLISGFSGVRSKFLIISITSDWLYPPYQSQEIVSALSANEADVQYCEIRSNYGHDAFLLEAGQLNYLISRFLNHTVVRDVMVQDVPVIAESASIDDAARQIIEREVNHLPVLSADGRLAGIVTSWDIAKAVAGRHRCLEEIMTRTVITSTADETIEAAVKRMGKFNISALPVVDADQRVIGIISSDGISSLVGRCT
ncbi:MAG: homoserine O-acetyltransferase [Methanomicrobiales archaeon]|nr:homoserine O-acetyltransferase [Methanomicrobiales archaeon]MDI6875628.1 homoserine O-acetyltransferase [Methanomicrobiales archaeon]